MANIKTVSPEQVKVIVDRVISVGGFIAKLTPFTDVDDRIVDILSQFAAQPWFVEIVSALLNLLEGQKMNSVDQDTLVRKLLLEKLSK